MSLLFRNRLFAPPAGWIRISTIELHTGGEPLRVFVDGIPELQGETVLEKRSYFRRHFDHLRTGLMWEPRGHADMYGAVVTTSRDADFDVFFLHNEGYSTMCGHAVIALTKLMYETDRNPPIPYRLTINAPCGRVESWIETEAGNSNPIRFRNVPSFVYLADQTVAIDGIGEVAYDIVYGGAYYACVRAEEAGLQLDGASFHRIIEMGKRIKNAVIEKTAIRHPFDEEAGFLYGVIFVSSPVDPRHHSRNVCVFANGEVDRSPTGSGVSGRAALHFSRGELELDESITIESIVGSTMTVRVIDQVDFGGFPAVVPEVGGSAHVIGRSEFFFDPADPFNRGFLFR